MTHSEEYSRFISECRRHLDALESDLLISWDPVLDDSLKIGEITRHFSMIKGIASLFPIRNLAEFSEAIEFKLEDSLSRDKVCSADLFASVLLCCGHIRDMVDGLEGELSPDDAHILKKSSWLVEKLSSL